MDEYLGIIKLWSGTYVPQGYLACNGQTLQVNEYQALYAVLGNIYGGTPGTTFALPDLRSRIPIGTGQGTGLMPYILNNTGGLEGVTLNTSQLPSHTHGASAQGSGATASASVTINAGNAGTTTNNPQGAYWGVAPNAGAFPVKPDTNAKNITMAPDAVTVAIDGDIDLANLTVYASGGNAAHENRQPYTALSYIICVSGYFPPRN